MLRPREAVGGQSTPCKDKMEGTGVRGGNPQCRILPPRTLFGTFSWERKYEPDIEDKKQRKNQQTQKVVFLRAAGWGKGDLFLCGCVGCFSNPEDSRKARAALGLRARSRGFTPVPHQGLTPPLDLRKGHRPLTRFGCLSLLSFQWRFGGRRESIHPPGYLPP